MPPWSACSMLKIFAVRTKDRGYAWVILAGSCFSFMVNYGFAMGLIGNITVIHQKQFNITLQQSSLITSVHYGILLVFAPVASIMVKKLSCRNTQVFGGVCTMTGIGLSALSSEAWHAYVLYSVAAALGLAASNMASSEILTLYFERWSYLAFGVATLGGYTGMVLLPSISQKLFDTVGYSYGMAVMSSFLLINVLAGILYMNPASDERQIGQVQLSQQDVEPGAVLSSAELANDFLSADGIKETISAEDRSKPGQPSNIRQSIMSLAKNIKTWALFCNCMLWSICLSSFLTIVNDFVISAMGLSSEEAALGITICGVANIGGTLLVIAISNLKYDRAILFCGSSVLYGIMTVVITLSSNKVWFYLITAVWGVGQGLQVANLLAVISDIGGPDQLALLFAIELLGEGVGGFSGPPLCGYMQAQFGAAAGFYLSGCAALAGSFCIVPVIILNARQRKQLPATDNNIASSV